VPFVKEQKFKLYSNASVLLNNHDRGEDKQVICSKSHPSFDANVIEALLESWNNPPSHPVRLSWDEADFVSANKCCKDETHLFHRKP
jgi:hypothetical protein